MKKTLCLLLVCLLLLPLLACGKEAAPETAALQVGFGRVDITPDSPMPLDGYGQSEKRLHANVLDKIYVSCVAVTDENDQTILLMSADVTQSRNHLDIRSQVSYATGIPIENILLAATHTHSSVDQGNSLAHRWIATYYTRSVEAAKAAMEDRAPAEVYIGSGKTENMNFVRHYLMMDGTYAGDNFGNYEAGYKAHASDNDPQLQVIKFVRTGEKKNILMVNWQGHPCITGGVARLDLSADYIGGTRTFVEYQTKDHFIYFLGASGNQNVKTYLPNEPAPPTDHNAFGAQLGQVVLDATNNMTKAEIGPIRVTKHTFVGQVDHSGDHLTEEARQVTELYNRTDRATANALAHELGLSSVYHASSILGKVNMEQTRELELYAVSVGSLSFAGVPYEMFADHGMYIKENSPAEMTFVMTCCNGTNTYIPTAFAYDYRCYESCVGYFTRGTGEILAEKYVELLTAHHTN